MRYDQKIYFVKNGHKLYNPETGNYYTSQPEKFPVYASVSGTEIQTQKLVYGEIRQGSKTVHILNQYIDPFDYIEIDGKKFSVDSQTLYRFKQAFVCHED